MNKYILGIDGGGTKTLGVLYSINGKEIDRTTSGFANFSVDEDLSKKHINEVIATLIKKCEKPYEVVMQMGIAGYSKIKHLGIYIAELKAAFNAHVEIHEDFHVALYSVNQVSLVPVIMAIGGTGSIVLLHDKINVSRFGGYGHLLGDEGSAYHAVMTVVKQMIERMDYHKRIKKLDKILLHHMQAYSTREVLSYVYNANKSQLAALAIHINDLAKNGDPYAKKILIDQAKMLSKQIVNAYDTLKSNEKVFIALKGGFILNAYGIKETIYDILKKEIKKCEIDECLVEPIRGAYVLGLNHFKRGKSNGRY